MNSKDEEFNTARKEAEIFDDLSKLCSSPGYIHAVAYFCWRDNIIKYGGHQIEETDLGHQYSSENLIRTEISALIGLMAKSEITLEVPAPKTLQRYIDETEALLRELHTSLQKPWFDAFEEMMKDPKAKEPIDPFSTAEGLREPIFYAGESAYNYQYGELAQQKYEADSDWLARNRGFTINEACLAARHLAEFQTQKIMATLEAFRETHPDNWTFLPGFTFHASDLEKLTGLSQEKLLCILKAFTFDEETRRVRPVRPSG